MDKFKSLQALRAIAAWAVVFHHYLQSYYFDHGRPVSRLLAPLYEASAFGVSLFFVLSGFVMCLSVMGKDISWSSFFLNRLLRIIPAYWFYTLILVASLCVIPHFFSTTFNPLFLIQSLFFYPSINPALPGHYPVPVLYVGWTLIFEFFFYTLLTVSIFISKKYSIGISTIILIILAVPLGGENYLGHPNSLFTEFLTGLLIAVAWKYGGNLLRKNAAVLSSLCLLAAGSLFYFQHFAALKWYMAGLIVVIFLLQEKVFNRPGRGWKLLVHLGDLSYSTYLCHIIVFGWAIYLIGYDLSGPVEFMTIISLIAIIYTTSYLSYRYIETNSLVLNLRKKFRKGFLPGPLTTASAASSSKHFSPSPSSVRR